MCSSEKTYYTKTDVYKMLLNNSHFNLSYKKDHFDS